MPRKSHMAKASHSEPEKWPGIAGMTFISIKVRETKIPRSAMMRRRADFSSNRKERQAANHPTEQAREPTSVTETRMASPANKPISVAELTARIATIGVRYWL